MAARSSTSFLVDREFTTTKYNSSAADINVTGTFDIDSTGALSINASAGAINVGNDANAYAVNIGTGAAARTITLGNVTAATTVALNSGTGGFALTSTGTTATTTVNNGLVAKSGTAAAIATTRTLTVADSGGIFSVAKTGAYAITLPTPAQGISFKFLVLDTGANIVTISDGSAHLFGAVSVNNVLTAMTGTTLSLASGGSVGDWVQFQAIDATHYLVTGACIAAADITIA